MTGRRDFVMGMAEMLVEASWEDAVFLRRNRELHRGPWGLLCNRRIRRSSTRALSPVAEKYARKIAEAMEKGQPIQFVLIDFAFKCGRPRWTNRTTPDAGELWQLAQLRRIAKGIKEVYPPGATVCILTEGEMLAPFLGVSEEERERYEGCLKEFAVLLQAPISFYSLQQLTNQVPQFEAAFEKELRKMKEDVDDHWLTMFYYGQNTSTPSKERALRVCARYRAFHAAVRELKIVKEFLPEHLPISSVATNGQYAYWPVERGCRLLPHRGVPVRVNGKKQIVPLEKLDPRALPVYLDGAEKPFYYLAPVT